MRSPYVYLQGLIITEPRDKTIKNHFNIKHMGQAHLFLDENQINFSALESRSIVFLPFGQSFVLLELATYITPNLLWKFNEIVYL